MALIRLQENVPNVYINNSRDFQLLCRVFDCVNNGVMLDINSIRHNTDIEVSRDKYLEILQYRNNFFPEIELEPKYLRMIFSALPHILKNKGNLTGIQYVINLYCKISHFKGDIIATKGYMGDNFIILLTINGKPGRIPLIKDFKLLDMLLKYVIPAGMSVMYRFNASEPTESNILNISDVHVITSTTNNTIRKNDYKDPVINRNLMSVNTSMLSGNLTIVEGEEDDNG